MHSIDAACCYRCSSLCLHVSHDHVLCKNGWSNQDVIWEYKFMWVKGRDTFWEGCVQTYCPLKCRDIWWHMKAKVPKVCMAVVSTITRHVGSKTLHQQNPPVLSWRCFAFAFLPSVLWHCWLGVRKSIRPPACKNLVLRCCCGYLSEARCRLFAYGPADATAIPKPHHLLPHWNPDWFCISGTGLPRLS